MLSHPFCWSLTAGWVADAEPASEKMAIFGFFGLEACEPVVRAACACEVCGSSADKENGSILEASAGRTAGNAGEEGPPSCVCCRS